VLKDFYVPTYYRDCLKKKQVTILSLLSGCVVSAIMMLGYAKELHLFRVGVQTPTGKKSGETRFLHTKIIYEVHRL
jgi:hypothetical protein